MKITHKTPMGSGQHERERVFAGNWGKLAEVRTWVNRRLERYLFNSLPTTLSSVPEQYAHADVSKGAFDTLYHPPTAFDSTKSRGETSTGGYTPSMLEDQYKVLKYSVGN